MEIIKIKLTRYFLKIIPILFFVGISVFLYFYSSPEGLKSLIGTENGYIFIFVLAFLGGLSTFSGVPYHLVLITLAVGGFDPLYLGLAAAFGVILGDSTSYYIGYQSGDIAPEKIQTKFEKIKDYALDRPVLFFMFCLLYGSLIPFSNDFIAITSGAVRYPFWKVMIPLGIGNIIFNVWLGYAASYFYDVIKGYL